MTAHARTRIEGLKTIGLGFGGIDYFPNVNIHTSTEHGELVHQSNIDVSVGVLQKFFHFSDCRRGNLVNFTLQYIAIKLCYNFRRVFAYSANNFWSVFRLVQEISRIDSFG